MHKSALDDETIAAFLDGRLSPAERERVLTLIASDDTWREVLGEAAGLLADAGAASPGGVDQPVPRRSTYRAWIGSVQLLAAGLTIVAGLLWLTSRKSASAAPDVFVLAITTEQSSGAPAWSAGGWPTTRAGSDDVTLEVRSARLGVLAVDVLRATVRRDTSGAHATRRMLNEVLQGITGGALIMQRLETATSAAALRTVLSDVRVLGDTTRFDLAARLELLRVTGFESPGLQAVREGIDSVVMNTRRSSTSPVSTAERSIRPATPPAPETAARLEALLDSLTRGSAQP